MSQETVNYELQPNTEEFDYVYEQLLGAMHETFERLNATSGEVVPVTREGAQGHFFYFASPEQTISEIYFKDNSGPTPDVEPGSAQRLSKHLLIETSRTSLDSNERRLRYHQFDPGGTECVIDVNPTGELQYESTSEIDALTTSLNSLLEDFKLLERSH